MSNNSSHLEQRIKELEELNVLAQTLSGTTNVDETLMAIISASLRLCHAERAAVVLLDPSSSEIVKTLVRNSSSIQDTIDHQLNTLVTGWVMGKGKPFHTDDILEELNLRKPSSRQQQCGPSLAVPLSVGGKITGVLHLLNSKGGKVFSDDAVRVLHIIASFAAQFIHRAELHEVLFSDNTRLKNELEERYGIHAMIGASAAMKEVFKTISLLSNSTATVLLVGETGTGKELIARALHYQSPRAHESFIPINCAAIPSALFESELFGSEKGSFTGSTEMRKGKFELAHKGTIFLDEISEMPSELQPKLLRVLEERKCYRVGSSSGIALDVRVIAATSVDLMKAVSEGKFREALYHRLNVVPVYLPALRERREDIPLLAQAFLNEFTQGAKQFQDDALQRLSSLQWQGNVRELKNVVERLSIFIQSKTISAGDLSRLGIGNDPQSLPQLSRTFQSLLDANDTEKDLLEFVEKNLVQLALQQTGRNVLQASKLLGIDRNALQRRIEKYHL